MCSYVLKDGVLDNLIFISSNLEEGEFAVYLVVGAGS